MKLKCLAVVGALLMAAPASAFAAKPIEDKGIVNNGTEVPKGAQLSSVFSVIAGSFTFSLSAWGTNSDSSGTITASLVDASLTVLQSLVLTVSGKTEKSVATEPFNLAAGAYKIMWTGTAVGTGAVKGTASLVGPGQTVAVPGPEAGAGIGALAMAGVAFLIRKRRRSLAA